MSGLLQKEVVVVSVATHDHQSAALDLRREAHILGIGNIIVRYYRFGLLGSHPVNSITVFVPFEPISRPSTAVHPKRGSDACGCEGRLLVPL
jgi:hypothetical protein